MVRRQSIQPIVAIQLFVGGVLALVPAFGWAQAGAAGSSANPEQPAAKETPVFRTNANLVVVDVVVRDKGQPVHGLKAADFQIREDGKEQKISVFEEHSG